MIARTRIILATPLVLALMLAGNAFAGEYTIHNCAASLQPNFEAGPWRSFGGPLSSGGFQATCTSGSTLGASIGWYGSEQSLNSNLGVVIQSPTPAITIREVRLVWSVAHQSSGSDPYAQISTDSGAVLIATTPYMASAASPTRLSFSAGTQSVIVYSYCSYDASTNCYFPSGASPIIRVEGMDTTLEDSGSPTATISGGSLAGTGVSGDGALQFTASDTDSGVREAELLVDGRPLVTTSFSSQCSYTSFAACPQSQAGTLTWDTTTVANGEHQVALRVTDAAGDSQTIDSHTVVVSNTPTIGNSPGTPDTPPSGGIATPPLACGAAPGTHTKIIVTAKHDLISTAYHKRAQLRGALTGSDGKPISGATIEVVTRPAIPGSEYTPLGPITTGTHGRFRMTLPSRTSDTVCLRYQQLPGGRYAAALAVTQQVRAGVTLSVHPKNVESNGTITLTGNVLGGYIPAAGKVVELLVLYLGHWRVFETVRTEPSGHYTSFYGFLGGLGTFEFRSRVRGENGYPYALGYSNPVRVRAG